MRRLYLAFKPQQTQPDDQWALSELRVEEQGLYKAMDTRDREHAVSVAKRLIGCYPDAPGYAVRAALLHDSGKALRPYQPLERILTGIFTPEVAIEPLRKGIYGAWQVRRFHPQYAAQKILDPQVAQIVREHHQPQTLWAKRLHEVDEEF